MFFVIGKVIAGTGSIAWKSLNTKGNKEVMKPTDITLNLSFTLVLMYYCRAVILELGTSMKA